MKGGDVQNLLQQKTNHKRKPILFARSPGKRILEALEKEIHKKWVMFFTGRSGETKTAQSFITERGGDV